MPLTVVLVVGPDSEFRKYATAVLKASDQRVSASLTAKDALQRVSEGGVGLLLADADLPEMPSKEFIRRVRDESPSLPLLMIAAGPPADERVVGALEAGADDLIFKPVSPAILKARVGAALRRRMWEGHQEKEFLSVGGIKLDVARHKVEVAGETVNLPPKEFEILAYFLRHPNVVFSKGKIHSALWGSSSSSSYQTVERQVESLRRRLGEAGLRIVTVPKLGYRFESD